MKTYCYSFLRVAAYLMLLCSISIVDRTATACPVEFSGSTIFTASPGGSQTQTWKVTGLVAGGSFTITAGSDVFSVSPITSFSFDSGTFTITFKPGANSSGTFKGTMTCPCNRTVELVGTVSSSGVTNSLPSNVSFNITPNPATENVNIFSSGVRTVEIGIYDLLGKRIASSKATIWTWEATSFPTGSYWVRIVGESNSGEQFVIWRRVIIAR